MKKNRTGIMTGRPGTGITAAVLALLAILSLTGPSVAADRALLIGVNQYKHLGERFQLTGSVNDARAFAGLARKVWGFRPENTRLLLDSEATSHNIIATIGDWLVRGTKKGDRVLLFYSGHGFYEKDLDGDESDGFDETLAPHDVRIDGTATKNMISDDVLARLLDKLKDRKVMLVIDSCHSGTVTRGLSFPDGSRKAIVRSLRDGHITRSLQDNSYQKYRDETAFVKRGKNLVVWSAVAASQKALENMAQGKEKRMGLFTHNFIEGLQHAKADANRNGHISGSEMLAYLRTSASDYCKKFLCETAMTPTLEAPEKSLGENLLAWRSIVQAEKQAPEDQTGTAQGTGTPGGPSLSLPFEEKAAFEEKPAFEKKPVFAKKTEGHASRPVTPDTSRTDKAGQPDITDLLPQLRDGAVRIEILPGAQLRAGDKIKVRITSNRPGWLILIDIHENGEMTQLFPNRYSKRASRKLAINAPLTIPDASYGFEFTADTPGKSTVLAILSEDNIPLEDLLGKNKDLSLIPEQQQKPYLSRIAKRLLSVWTKGKDSRAVRWSLARTGYVITK